MALKTKIKRENVVSEEDGVVEWITDKGAMMKTPASECTIIESPSEETTQKAHEEDQAAEAAQGDDSSPEEPDPAQPEKPKKEKKAPPKAKAKAKTAKMVVNPTPAPAPTPDPVPDPPQTSKAKSASATKEKTVATVKKAKKSTAKGVRTIGGKEVDLSGYKKVKAPGGGVSYTKGDAVANKLEGKSLDEVYKIAAAALKVPESELRAKYKKLNPGMQRMSLGNRMRGGPKKEKKS